MKRLLVLIIVFSIAWVSCKRDVPTTPLKVCSYFPVYPGSWWTYIGSAGDTTTHSTSKGYVYCKATQDIWPGQSIQIGPYLLTHYDGVPIIVDGRPGNSYAPDGIFKFLDTIGPEGSVVGDYGHWGIEDKYQISAKETSMIVHGIRYTDIIGMNEMHSQGGFMTNYHLVYYARHVGIVKIIDAQRKMPPDTGFVYTTTDLVSYFVNSH